MSICKMGTITVGLPQSGLEEVFQHIEMPSAKCHLMSLKGTLALPGHYKLFSDMGIDLERSYIKIAVRMIGFKGGSHILFCYQVDSGFPY